jgi:hypothetical protein
MQLLNLRSLELLYNLNHHKCLDLKPNTLHRFTRNYHLNNTNPTHNHNQPQAPEAEPPKDVKDEINDLDRRVREAIKNSEEAIQRNAGLQKA